MVPSPFNRRDINAQLMDVGYIFFMIRVNCDNHATLASRPRLWIAGVPHPEATPETFEQVQSWAGDFEQELRQATMPLASYFMSDTDGDYKHFMDSVLGRKRRKKSGVQWQKYAPTRG